MIPEIKWLQKYDKVRITITLFQVDEINKQDCSVSLEDNVLSFKYQNYEFSERLNHTANWKFTVDYRGRYAKVVILKQKQMEEWDYLFENRKFNKTHVKVDWSDWTFEEERVNDMFNKHAGDDNIRKMMEQYQLQDNQPEEEPQEPQEPHEPHEPQETQEPQEPQETQEPKELQQSVSNS